MTFMYDSMLLLDYEEIGSRTYLSRNGQYKLIGSLIEIRASELHREGGAGASTFTATTQTPKMHLLRSLLASSLLFTPQHLETLISQSANYLHRKPTSSKNCGRSQLPGGTFLIQDLHGMLSFLSMSVSSGRFPAHSPVVNGSSLFLSYRWICPLF